MIIFVVNPPLPLWKILDYFPNIFSKLRRVKLIYILSGSYMICDIHMVFYTFAKKERVGCVWGGIFLYLVFSEHIVCFQPGQLCITLIEWKWIFVDTVSTNKNYAVDTVSTNKNYAVDTLSAPCTKSALCTKTAIWNNVHFVL